jgi:hypothetical protein
MVEMSMYNSAINQNRPEATVRSQQRGLTGYNSPENGFQKLLSNALTSSTADKYDNSALTSNGPPIALSQIVPIGVNGTNSAAYSRSVTDLTSTNGSGKIPSMILAIKSLAANTIRNPDTNPLFPPASRNINPTTNITNVTPYGEKYQYRIEDVGEIERAPHAMFEHNGELVMSTISRNGISHTPIYTYSDENGLQKRSRLPDSNEAGNYGFSFDDGLHIVVEAWEGMIDYVAQSPDGPWVKNDYTHLNPHSYKNLKWGYGYRCPVTGQQFMGFGNDKHPGMVITRQAGEWKRLTAPKDMLFPTSMGVIDDGPNAGTRLICSSTYGETRLHAVDANGHTSKLGDFKGWSYMVADHNNRIAYVATEKGNVHWSSFDDLKNWRECEYQDGQGNSLDKLGRCGEMNVHPQTGQVILPVADGGHISNNKPTAHMGTNLYEAVPVDNTVVFRQVGRIEDAGLWELRSSVVGDDLYYGTGLVSNKKQDAAPGGIYKIGTSGDISEFYDTENDTDSPALPHRSATEEDYVNGLYKVFFDREPDLDGWKYHLSRLNSGTNRNEVLKGFLYSPEFKNLCEKHGIGEEERNAVSRLYTL